MDDLIRSCLRMKPHDIGWRGSRTEALTAMEAWNTGILRVDDHPCEQCDEGLNRIVSFARRRRIHSQPTFARIIAETIHSVVYIKPGVSFRATQVKSLFVKGHDGERFAIEQL